MSIITVDGSRFGDVRSELVSLVAGTAFEPGRARGGEARALLDQDGAVILAGLPAEPDSLVLAAAEVLGTRLRQLYPVRERGSAHDDSIQLHNDSHHVAVDVHGQITTLRDPDEDYLLIQCVRQAACGGSSVIVDDYRVVDLLRNTHPELWEFLTTVDVDFYGGWQPQRGVPGTPQVPPRRVDPGRPAHRAGEPRRPADAARTPVRTPGGDAGSLRRRPGHARRRSTAGDPARRGDPADRQLPLLARA